MLTTLALVAATVCAQPDPFSDLITRPKPIEIGLDERWEQSGSLERSDLAHPDGSKFDLWPVVLPKGVWNIQVQSEEFDAYMSIFLEEGGVTRADLMIEDDDGGWMDGAAGITARVTKEELIGIGASSYDADVLGPYQVVIRRVPDFVPAVPARDLAKIQVLEEPVFEALDYYLEEGPHDLSHAIAAADAVVKLRAVHQGTLNDQWWELVDARQNAAYLRRLGGLSVEEFGQLQRAEQAYWAGDEADTDEDDATAKDQFTRALAGYEQVLGKDDLQVALTLSSLANTLEYLDDLDGAVRARERQIEILEKVLGPSHPETSLAITGLGALHYSMENYEAAHANFITALEINRETRDPRDISLGTSLSNLANTKDTLGMATSARRLYEEKAALYEQFYGSEHLLTAVELGTLGEHLFLMQEFGDARDVLSRALPVYEEGFGEDHPETLQILEDLAYCEHAELAYEQAVEHFRAVLAGRAHLPWALDEPGADVRRMIGLSQEALGDYASALAMHEQVLAFWVEAEGEDSAMAQRSRDEIARVKAAMK